MNLSWKSLLKWSAGDVTPSCFGLDLRSIIGYPIMGAVIGGHAPTKESVSLFILTVRDDAELFEQLRRLLLLKITILFYSGQRIVVEPIA